MSPVPPAPAGLIRRLEWRDPLDAFAALADTPYALLLHDGLSGRALVFAHPGARFEGDGRDVFDAAAAHWRDAAPARLAGLFGYDLAGAFEAIPGFASPWPHMALGAYPAFAEFDPEKKEIRLQGETEDALDGLADALSRPAPAFPAPRSKGWRAHWTREAYEAAARKARDYVLAGDVFQVNLSQRFQTRLEPGGHPYGVFLALAERSPAPFAGYMRLDADRVLLSNSPERFLSLDAAGRAVSEPIKGTRPRGETPERDAALAEELAGSAKDRAENLMIVDLMRHDLSRVCTPGSVRVPQICEAQAFANVHHLVSRVTGELAKGRDAFDLVAASFPPGSITGAPKVRAMEIIAELEGEARGPYCGALGWIGPDGAMDLNVMIRTAAFLRDGLGWMATVRSGGGIVSDSEPASEYEETLAKASALRVALQGAGQAPHTTEGRT